MPTLWTLGTSTRSIEELVSIASSSRTALLCAEALPWKCHRRFIAQAMEKQGRQTIHILGESRVWNAEDVFI